MCQVADPMYLALFIKCPAMTKVLWRRSHWSMFKTMSCDVKNFNYYLCVFIWSFLNFLKKIWFIWFNTCYTLPLPDIFSVLKLSNWDEIEIKAVKLKWITLDVLPGLVNSPTSPMRKLSSSFMARRLFSWKSISSFFMFSSVFRRSICRSNLAVWKDYTCIVF